MNARELIEAVVRGEDPKTLLEGLPWKTPQAVAFIKNARKKYLPIIKKLASDLKAKKIKREQDGMTERVIGPNEKGPWKDTYFTINMVSPRPEDKLWWGPPKLYVSPELDKKVGKGSTAKVMSAFGNPREKDSKGWFTLEPAEDKTRAPDLRQVASKRAGKDYAMSLDINRAVSRSMINR